MRPGTPLRNSLGLKLFASHLIIVVIGSLVYSLVARLHAPTALSHRMALMGSMMRGETMAGPDLEQTFLAAVNEIMLISGILAAATAVVVSSVITWRIVSPIRALRTASERIAGGDYSERLNVRSGDELGQLAGAFNSMAAALDDTEKRRIQLIGDVGHELRTPLTNIRSIMEALVDGVLPAGEETFLDVQREASRLERLSNDLVELSRAESGALSMEVTDAGVRDVCERAVKRLSQQFEDKGVQLTVTIPPDMPSVRMDPERITQVMINLLGNAVQYTDAGGTVDVRVEQAGSEVRIVVSDSGAGLAPADLSRVFERFYRVDHSRGRVGGGSGIGLAIAKHIVRAHGGSIQVQSEGPGRGSTFNFTLPL